MSADEVRDEAYERFSCTGPEFDGWLSNHGPMAADALIRLGRADVVEDWVGGYVHRLEDEPSPRWTIDDRGWREPLGDPSRLGDWLEFFERRVHDEPWQDLLARWWPRLLPGAIASSTHGLIRTGHAVRALREHGTPQRLDELGQALGYWAARWHPLHGAPAPSGTTGVDDAMEALPIIEPEGGTRTRLARLAELPAWSRVIGSARPAGSAAEVPAALDELVDLAVGRYQRWAHGSPCCSCTPRPRPAPPRSCCPRSPRRCGRPPTTWRGR